MKPFEEYTTYQGKKIYTLNLGIIYLRVWEENGVWIAAYYAFNDETRLVRKFAKRTSAEGVLLRVVKRALIDALKEFE